MIWRWLFNSKYGLLNQLSQAIGVDTNIQWLSVPDVVIWSLIIVGIWSSVGYNMILLLADLQEIPETYYEAAMMDGASVWQVFSQIHFPLAKSGLVSLAIFTSITAYKDLMWSLVVNISQEKLTISAGLSSLQGQYVTDYPLLMAGAAISILPIVILFIIFQNQFVRGIADTGRK